MVANLEPASPAPILACCASVSVLYHCIVALTRLVRGQPLRNRARNEVGEIRGRTRLSAAEAEIRRIRSRWAIHLLECVGGRTSSLRIRSKLKEAR
ncbi:hypothetical protein L226DRAFT_199840 [Lentinus tigrinus ALCF2SS1-7]|uniref:Uncharacterized protein n=1 Tax=Lentinus tigrinus ALCF2SS1-6 TaxID=1328759 RepID=A0A5C2SS23_9APHY|nr:hypothetical protein L227DRAFT_145841 [Lentinus tigrinus ALCF2SS1-6]RPD80403.1 hypothetical protein L226DRAFT_199840 [Lentinus tigrinus ALCF2SS1-7]